MLSPSAARSDSNIPRNRRQ